MKTVNELLVEALDNAAANGYADDLAKMSNEELAIDLTSYNVDFENMDLEEVINAIAEHRKGDVL